MPEQKSSVAPTSDSDKTEDTILNVEAGSCACAKNASINTTPARSKHDNPNITQPRRTTAGCIEENGDSEVEGRNDESSESKSSLRRFARKKHDNAPRLAATATRRARLQG